MGSVVVEVFEKEPLEEGNLSVVISNGAYVSI